jgi:hypothetical protein
MSKRTIKRHPQLDKLGPSLVELHLQKKIDQALKIIDYQKALIVNLKKALRRVRGKK